MFCQAYIPPAKRSREKCQPPDSSSKSEPILCATFNRDTVIRLCRRTTFTCVSSQQQSRLFSIWDNFWFCAPNGIDNVLAMILECYKNNTIWLYCVHKIAKHHTIWYDHLICYQMTNTAFEINVAHWEAGGGGGAFWICQFWKYFIGHPMINVMGFGNRMAPFL